MSVPDHLLEPPDDSHCPECERCGEPEHCAGSACANIEVAVQSLIRVGFAEDGDCNCPCSGCTEARCDDEAEHSRCARHDNSDQSEGS